MADNVTLDAGSGGDTIAADDVGGVKYQVVKIDVGGDGLAAPLSTSNPIPVSDAGGALTVDGTVAVTNAGLTELAAAINASSQVDVNIAASGATVPISHAALTELAAAIDTELQVDVVSSALPTGAATAANQSTGNTALAAIQTAVELIDNVVKAEDAAHSTGDSGVMALAVRQSSQADFGADGDYVPFSVDDDGGLRVSIVAGAGSGGTAAADDADFTAGTTNGTPAMGVYESSPTSVTDGDLGTVGITQTRELKVSVTSGGITGVTEDAASSGGEEGVLAMAVRRDTAASSSGTDGDFSTLNVDSTGRLWCNVSNTVTVGSHAVTNAGTFAVQVSSIAAGNNNIGDVDIASIAAGDNNIGNVDVASSALPTGAATSALQAAAASHYRNIDANAEAEIKGSAGTLYWLHAMNLTAAKAYVHLYDATAANVTPGSTTPNYTFPIGTQGDTNGAGFVMNFGGKGQAFANGITLVVTTTVDGSAGDPGTNGVFVNAGYT